MSNMLAPGVTHLITLRLGLSLSTTGGAHGATSDVAGRGVGRGVGGGGFWTVWTGPRDVGGTGVVEVGEPSSPNGLIGRSPKSACMRHNNARRGRSQQKLRGRGRKGEVESKQEEWGPGMREKKKQGSSRPVSGRKRVADGRSEQGWLLLSRDQRRP